MSPPATTPGKKEDPRLWWLPAPLILTATAAAFYAGIQLANLNTTVRSMNKNMLTLEQFKDWCYATERINVRSNWSSGTIPVRAAD